MRNLLTHWRWIVLLLCYSADAHAWGLYTHIYFAQHLLWAVVLTDPRHCRAIRRFPGLVLAGACLPDLSLVGRHCGVPNASHSHLWQNPHDLLCNAQDDAECAIAVGYTSHLWVDIVAHNHFVPAHERLWGNVPLLTHAAAEWAMDHHVSPQLYAHPAELLRTHEAMLIPFVSSHFGASQDAARKAVRALSRAETVLRRAGVPRICFEAARALDRGLQRRFNYYMSETSARLRHINRLLAGETPEWLADPPSAETTRPHIDGLSRFKLRHRIPIPHDFFVPAQT